MTTTYECDNCGECCRSTIVHLYRVDLLREPKLDAVSTRFQVEHDDGAVAMMRAFPCKMLTDDRRCGIYPTRPTECVEYDPGSEHCQELREEAGLELLKPITTT